MDMVLPIETCNVNLGHIMADCGSTVVKALYYKSEGRWFDPSRVK